jgi:squalene synthase HpnC
MVVDVVRALTHPPSTPPNLREAASYCRGLTRAHYENFTVLSWFVPHPLRAHVAALYAYCRTVDDLGDEAPGDRSELLDRFEGELDAAYQGRARHPVLVALQETIRQFGLPREPLSRLIEANRIDQRTTYYETFDDLLAYCTYSANPVGRLVLALYGLRDEERGVLSDETCTALQLTNFWQDVRRDARMGRTYLPQDEMAMFGVDEADLAAAKGSDPFRRLMQYEVERTRRYFARGLPLVDRVSGRLKIVLTLFSRGGIAILDKIEAIGFDTLRERPVLSAPEKRRLIGATLVPLRRKPWI